MANNSNTVGIGPTGPQCLPQKAPGGEYSLQQGSCLAGTALISGNGPYAGKLPCGGGIRLPPLLGVTGSLGCRRLSELILNQPMGIRINGPFHSAAKPIASLP
jgi:hypothetical protein